MPKMMTLKTRPEKVVAGGSWFRTIRGYPRGINWRMFTASFSVDDVGFRLVKRW